MDLTTLFSEWLPPILRVAAAAFATWLAARLAVRLAVRAPEPIRRQVAYLAPKVVWGLGLLVMLGSLGVNIGSVLALMATLGVGAALVFTPVGQNLISGFLAGIDDVIRVGDVIEVQGKAGTVVRTGKLSVGVEFPDGSMVYMPNVRTVDDELTNHSRAPGARIDVEIKLDHSPDRRRAVEVMTSTLQELPFRVQDKPVSVHFTEIGDSALHFRCYAWISDRLDAPGRKSEMLSAIVDALEADGVSVGETTQVSASDFAVRGATLTGA